MTDGRGLELGGPDPFAGDVEGVIGAAVEEPVPVVVDRGPVTVRPDAWEPPPVGVEETLPVLPKSARHSRPRVPADELADLAAQRTAVLIDDVHVLPESWESERNRLDRLGHDGRQEACADLGPARYVHDRNAPAARALEQPQVRVAVPRLAGRAERLQRRHVRGRIALRDESPDERRRDPEHRHPLLLDGPPDPVVR